MKNQLLVALPFLALTQVVVSAQAISAPQPAKLKPASPALAANYGKLPLSFEANQGQTDAQVKFLSRGQGYSLFLTDSAAVLELSKPEVPKSRVASEKDPLARKAAKPGKMKTDVVRMELAGAAHGLQVTGADQLPGKSNYFIGKDPANWRTNVPTYAKVKYTGVYPGIDLVYYGNQQQLEYDFVVAPNSDAKPIKLHFAGADKLSLSADGDLTVAAKNGEIAFHKPVVYQDKNGQREPVAGNFTLLARNTVGFQLGDYDHSRAVVIDPTLAYSTYLGGSKASLSSLGNFVGSMAVDDAGNVYVAGAAISPDFPLSSGAFQRTINVSGGGFISKLNSAGSTLLYSTFLTGSSVHYANASVYPDVTIYGIAVDQSGDAYLTGQALAPDFPTTPGALQTTNTLNGKGFATKLNPSGSALLYSTLIGGSAIDSAFGIALNPEGNAYITGYTESTDFPTTPGTLKPVDNSPGDPAGFVVELNQTGTGLVYGTYLGGNPTPYRGIGTTAYSIALDKTGDAYIQGETDSPDFPTTSGAYLTTNTYPGFVLKLNPKGSSLMYSTYFPYYPSQYMGDSYGNIVVDSTGSLYTTAYSGPVSKGAYKTDGQGWVGKLNPTGTALVYGTYVGGYGAFGLPSILQKVAIDSERNAFVVGYSYGNFPTTPDAFQKTWNGQLDSGRQSASSDAVLAEINQDGTGLLYATYLGGTGFNDTSLGVVGDRASAIAIDGANNVYFAGYAYSQDFPVTSGAFQTRNHSTDGGNAFVAKVAFHGATTTTIVSSVPSQALGGAVTLTATTALVDGGIPTGHMRFVADGTILDPVITLDVTGHADYDISTLPVGFHLITADYLGSPTASASSGTVTQAITGGQVEAPIFSLLGGTYQYQPLVSLSTPTAGASIHYTTDGTNPSTASALYVSPVRVAVSETVKAVAALSGNAPSAVASAAYSIVPTAIATTTRMKSSANPSSLGQSVTFTARVTAASGPTPTGSVSFLNGNQVIGTSSLVNGLTTFTYSGLTVNGHDITTIYLGNATDAVSGSPVLRQYVIP